MGCTQGSPETNNNNTNPNNKTTKNNDKNNPNDATNEAPVAVNNNTHISLNIREIFRLKASWKAIRRGLVETGVLTFVKMFENNPELLTYFEKFVKMDKSKLYESELLKNHANTIMTEIDNAVTELDQEASYTNLKKIGSDHKKRGIKDVFFLELKQPFLLAVETTLGDRYTEQIKAIYEVFTDYLVKTLIEGFNS